MLRSRFALENDEATVSFSPGTRHLIELSRERRSGYAPAGAVPSPKIPSRINPQNIFIHTLAFRLKMHIIRIILINNRGNGPNG
jgi:hypothetical protein